MKNLIKYIGSLFFLLLFATQLSAQSSNVSLSIGCPATVISGTSININAAYGYSNITGNITVVVNYDATKVTFLNSTGFGLAVPVLGGSGASSKVTYTFAATSGLNQTGAIQLHFTAICPQTCFGVTNIANFSGTISAPGATTIATTPCGTNLNVINDWGGSMYVSAYNCKLNQVTFNVNITRSSCYRIINPTLTVSSSVGTVISSSGGTLAGNTVTLASPLFSNRNITVTVQLPCNPVTGTPTFTAGPVTCTAILNGDNCGNYFPNIKTYSTTYNVVPQNSQASLSCTAASGNSYVVVVTNFGKSAINANLTTNLPNLNYTGFTHSTNQSTPISGSYKTFDCGMIASASIPFTSTPIVNTVVIGSIKKMDYTISNLQPGQSFFMTFTYSGATPSCLPAAISPYNFSTSGNYTGIPDPADCNCTYNLRNFSTASCSFADPSGLPNMICTGSTYNNSLCHRAGETLHFCLKFRNNGSGPLTNGILNLGLPTYLNLIPSTVTYDGLTTGISSTLSGLITLPSSIATGPDHTVCFDATLNSTASNGLHSLNPKISGDNLSLRNICSYQVLICQDAKAEISKKVKGSEDIIFSTSGSALPGSIATYQITINNSGNTPISSIQILDRLPEIGDKTIRNCTPRGSQFSVMPNGIFSPSSLASAANYSNSAPGINNIPANWSAALSAFPCDVSGIFSPGPKNTVLVNIPGPILPFTSYTFEMQVVIPATAKPGDQICNSVALKTMYQDETGAEYPLEIIESDKVCLIVAPPPCKPCPTMIKSETMTLNPGTVVNPGTPYVTKTGYVTITTLKPVQEIQINISDLQYHFNKKECKDCKTPALSRGGIFPLNTTQTVGTLIWDDFTGSSIPSATPVDNLPQELIWNLGVMLAPGTYTIPFQLTLPNSIIPDCCELILDKFALKVSVKDADCNVCENFVAPSTDNCCTGSFWDRKQMTWSLIHDSPHTVATKQTEVSKRKSDLKEIYDHNKEVISGNSLDNLIPSYSVLNIKCDETYRIMEGQNRTFNALFKCNPNMTNCESQSLVTITTQSGNYINVINQPMPYNQIFNLPGVYKIKYIGKCGGVICNTCEFTLIVEKNCCVGITKNGPTTVTADHIFQPNNTTSITSSPLLHLTAKSMATVNLNYSCTQNCSATYSWRRLKNGVQIDSGTSPNGIINFAPPTSGEDLIIITVNCGIQNCNRTERFFLGCEFCHIIFDPTSPRVPKK